MGKDGVLEILLLNLLLLFFDMGVQMLFIYSYRPTQMTPRRVLRLDFDSSQHLQPCEALS